MSAYGRRVVREVAQGARLAVNGTTLAPSPFCDPARVEAVAERLKQLGGTVPGQTELANELGVLYFRIGRSAVESTDIVE